MGKLVTQALAEKNLRAIYVTNRTYNHAVELAQEIGGRAMRYADGSALPLYRLV